MNHHFHADDTQVFFAYLLSIVSELKTLASYLIYSQALLEYVIIIMWLRSVIKMLQSVKFAEDKVLTFLILREKC